MELDDTNLYLSSDAVLLTKCKSQNWTLLWLFYLLWHVWAISTCRLAKRQKQNKKSKSRDASFSIKTNFDFRAMKIGLTT